GQIQIGVPGVQDLARHHTAAVAKRDAEERAAEAERGIYRNGQRAERSRRKTRERSADGPGRLEHDREVSLCSAAEARRARPGGGEHDQQKERRDPPQGWNAGARTACHTEKEDKTSPGTISIGYGSQRCSSTPNIRVRG